MVGQAVPDVGAEHREQPVDHFTRAGRTEQPERLRRPAHDPLRRDHVVEIADVIAVQMGEQHRVEHDREHARRDQPHAHRATRVDEHRAPAGAHERRGTSPLTVGNRIPSAQQHDLDRHTRRPYRPLPTLPPRSRGHPGRTRATTVLRMHDEGGGGVRRESVSRRSPRAGAGRGPRSQAREPASEPSRPSRSRTAAAGRTRSRAGWPGPRRRLRCAPRA